MSKAEDTIAALQSLKDRLEEVQSAKAHAQDEAEEAVEAGNAAGAESFASGFQSVHDDIEQLGERVTALIDAVDDISGKAQSVIDGT